MDLQTEIENRIDWFVKFGFDRLEAYKLALNLMGIGYYKHDGHICAEDL